jgi:hypothetical protein
VDAVTAGIAGFVIAPGKDNGDERFAVAVARQHHARRVAHPPGRGAAELGT